MISRRRSRPLHTTWKKASALAAALGLLAGCQSDALDPGDGIGGPIITLAPHTVALAISPERDIELGAALKVRVAANAGTTGAGVSSIGATALLLDSKGEIVTVVPLGLANFESPAFGVIEREFELRPPTRSLDLNALPGSVRLEVHGFVVASGGACAAAVATIGQRLPCGERDGRIVAIGERGEPFTVNVRPPHWVSLVSSAPARMEAGDLLSFTVGARSRAELGGITRVGVAARVKSAAGKQKTLVLGERSFAGAAEVNEPIQLSFGELARRLGDDFFAGSATRSVTIEPSAFAVHQTKACVAAVQTSMQQLPCADSNGVLVAASADPAPVAVTGVEGRTVALRGGVSDVGDLLLDSNGQRAFLSNRGGNTLEVLDLGSAGWSSVPVGSRPWGLSYSADGSSILVANSGGTNVSRVSVSNPREEERIPISRYTLYEISIVTEDTIDSTGTLRKKGTVWLKYFNYADRPQHLAQDAQGRILYSASSTQAAPVGTIRTVEKHPQTGKWEARMLFPEGLLVNTPPVENRAVRAEPGTVAIANVDSMQLVMKEDSLGQRYLTGEIIVFDHRPGHPDQPRKSVPLQVLEPGGWEKALKYLRGEFGSDIVTYPDHAWNVPTSNRMADTTFVAASTNHRFVVFGEGTTADAGRAMMWDADTAALSRVEDVRDLLNNGSDRISAVAMNGDGSLGLARGDQGVYFFDTRLRLQGTGGSALVGGKGLAYRSDGNRERVYVGTGRRTIQVIEPTNYRVVTEILIRSNLTGTLRAGPCAAGAPAGCTATLYGITAEGVVVVDVVEP